MMNLTFDHYDTVSYNWQRHFRFYYFADSDTNYMPTKDTVELTQNNGLKHYAYLQTLSFEMLSTPYMQYCQRNGKQRLYYRPSHLK